MNDSEGNSQTALTVRDLSDDVRPLFSPSATPLITPERLKANPIDALNFRPGWAFDFFLLHGDDVGLTYDQHVVMLVGSRKDHLLAWHLEAPFAAILVEILRYGHRFRVTDDGKGRHWYPSIQYKTPEGRLVDEGILGRLVLNAKPGQKVTPADNPGDLRPEGLHKAHGRGDKDSRSDALAHARSAAEASGLDAESVEQYVDNLRRLFALHDAANVFGIREVDPPDYF